MAKQQTQFECSECGRITPKFLGRCPKCSEFGTMVEKTIAGASSSSKATAKNRRANLGVDSNPVRLKNVNSVDFERMKLPNMQEFTRVLGGGIVPGSIILVGGEPGIGKSTLLLQTAALVANSYGRVLYVSGEESTRQIRMRADRLTVTADDLFLVTETHLQKILDHVADIKPKLLIVDSIQTTFADELSSAPGSVTQVRECASRLQELAKTQGIPVILVGHVTKEGTIAGPRVLEHIVDAVLFLEGDHFHRYRLLRGIKNRFGATSEVGVFEMLERGMVEVPNPSEAFLAERQVNASGSAISITMEGTRPLLVEIQSLTSQTPFSNPRRTSNGIDYNRLLMLTAVLSKRVNLDLSSKDVFVNVVGGLQIGEPASDLAVSIAIASSARDRAVHADMAFVGEVGLSGELRAVSQLSARLNEAAKLGFKRCIVPRTVRKSETTVPKGLELIVSRTLPDALQKALVPKAR